MKSITKYIAKQFGKPSGFGGLISTFVMNRLNGKQYRAVLNNLNLQSTDTILDIGFGNGYLIGKLLKRNPTKIYGIEISQDMQNKVGRKNKQAISTGRLDLRLADIKELPFENACFDKICTINTLYFWNDTESSFAEIKRTLKPNGIFLNTVYTKEWLDRLPYTQYGFSKYSVEQIVKMTEKSGLKVIRVIEIQPEISFCIIAEKSINNEYGNIQA